MNKITITVSGSAGSGKTAIQQWLAEQLSTKFNQVDIDWGMDGNPQRGPEDVEIVLNHIVDTTQINIKTQQSRRIESGEQHFGVEE